MVCPPRGEAGRMDRAQYRLLLPAPPQCQFACGLLYLLVPRNYPNCACMQLTLVSHCLSVFPCSKRSWSNVGTNTWVRDPRSQPISPGRRKVETFTDDVCRAGPHS